MPIYYKAVETPEYCFLSEAVEWLTLGIVPEAQWEFLDSVAPNNSTSELRECRFAHELMPENFEPREILAYFEPEDFNYAGVEYTAGYSTAAHQCFTYDLKRLSAEIEELRNAEPLLVENEQGQTVDLRRERYEDHKRLLTKYSDELALVQQVESQFDTRFESSWAQIYAAVATGRVTIEGIDFERWVEFKEQHDYVAAAEFRALPAKAVRLNLDWSKNQLNFEWREFVALRCRSAEIAELAAPTLMKSPAIEVRRSGEYLWSPETEQAPRAKRGRRPLLDWDRMRSHLSQMAENRVLPESKESCIYELIVFAEFTLGKKVGRSTVQDQLRTDLAFFYP